MLREIDTLDGVLAAMEQAYQRSRFREPALRHARPVPSDALAELRRAVEVCCPGQNGAGSPARFAVIVG